ncbi:hypothetical protein LTR36_004800 [Oleoguttula mirabilis]|uniref:Uncharacterized protein n=1 Tax=Oleoguttula mirabilis TaxID=1507867 RepID=A0AAV9JG50_9PEZI|nr:hypothetical protein LTR36_004800 [Oleoguttula mirabilis]
MEEFQKAGPSQHHSTTQGRSHRVRHDCLAVFVINELFTAIATNLPWQDILALQETRQSFRKTISSSPPVLRKLFLLPRPKTNQASDAVISTEDDDQEKDVEDGDLGGEDGSEEESYVGGQIGRRNTDRTGDMCCFYQCYPTTELVNPLTFNPPILYADHRLCWSQHYLWNTALFRKQVPWEAEDIYVEGVKGRAFLGFRVSPLSILEHHSCWNQYITDPPIERITVVWAIHLKSGVRHAEQDISVTDGVKFGDIARSIQDCAKSGNITLHPWLSPRGERPRPRDGFSIRTERTRFSAENVLVDSSYIRLDGAVLPKDEKVWRLIEYVNGSEWRLWDERKNDNQSEGLRSIREALRHSY